MLILYVNLHQNVTVTYFVLLLSELIHYSSKNIMQMEPA